MEIGSSRAQQANQHFADLAIRSAGLLLDQTWRLGLAPQQQGYRPSEGDVQEFRAALEVELSKVGF